MFKRLFKKLTNAEKSELYEYCGELFPQQPRAKFIANDKISMILTDIGASYIRTKEQLVTRQSSDLLRAPMGIYCFVKFGSDFFSTTFSPDYSEKVLYETAFLQNGVSYFARKPELKLETKIFIHKILPIVQQEIALENRSKNQETATLLFYFEPNIQFKSSIKNDKDSNILTFSIKEPCSEKQCYIAIGFNDGQAIIYETNREILFENVEEMSVKQSAFTDTFSQSEAENTSCLAIRREQLISKNHKKSLFMLYSIDETREQATSNIIKMREEEPINKETAAESKLRRSSLEQRIIKALLPQLLFGKRDSTNNLNAINQNHLNGKSLQELSISTDYPIAAVEIFSKLDIERVEVYLKAHSLLKKSFIDFSLVFLYDGDKEALAMINACALKYKENMDINKKAGIFIISKQEISEEKLNLIFAASCHIATRSLVRIEAVSQSYKPIKLNKCNTTKITTQENQLKIHNLENERLSTALFDRSIGYTTALFPSEIMLTKSYKDTFRKKEGELLIIKLHEEYYDIIDGSTPEFAEGFACYNAMVGELLIKTTVTIHKNEALKQIEVEINNTSYQSQQLELCFYTEPVMGKSSQNSRELCGEVVDDDSIILLTNDFNLEKSAYMAIATSDNEFKVCFDRALFFCGRWDNFSVLPQNDNCTAIIVSKEILPQKSIKTSFKMAFAESAEEIRGILHEPTNIF